MHTIIHTSRRIPPRVSQHSSLPPSPSLPCSSLTPLSLPPHLFSPLRHNPLINSHNHLPPQRPGLPYSTSKTTPPPPRNNRIPPLLRRDRPDQHLHIAPELPPPRLVVHLLPGRLEPGRDRRGARGRRRRWSGCGLLGVACGQAAGAGYRGRQRDLVLLRQGLEVGNAVYH